jgi:hypothetical protein
MMTQYIYYMTAVKLQIIIIITMLVSSANSTTLVPLSGVLVKSLI